MEFKIIDGNVYFKNEGMGCFSHFGPLYVSEPTETENQHETKKFDLTTGEYQHTNELTEWQGYTVTSGYYTYIPAASIPTDAEIIQAEMLLNQQDILINQAAHDEVLAAILLAQQGV